MTFEKDKSLVSQGYGLDKEEAITQKLYDWCGKENFTGENKGHVVELVGHFIPLFKGQGLQVITVGGTNGKGTCIFIEILFSNKKCQSIGNGREIID